MENPQQMRRRRHARSRRRGQSIPLIALMILVLVAMVGLSVDVGNTFSKERTAVTAANSAAIAGMTTYLQSRGNNAFRNQDVYDSIVESLASNNVTVGDGTNGTVNLQAYYLDSQGRMLSSTSPTIRNGDSSPTPANVNYVQVVLDGKVNTSFARVVGRPDLPINATSHAGTCPPGNGVYPIAVDNSLLSGNEFAKPANATAVEYQVLTSGDYSGLVQRRVYVKNGAPGGFSYLRWLSENSSAPELAASLAGGGNISDGFEEVVPWPASNLPKPDVYPYQPGTINSGDWIYSKTGNVNSSDVTGAINGHIGNGTRMILPIYDVVVGQGVNTYYRITRLGVFIITNQGQGGPNGPYFDMIFLGDPVNQTAACNVTPPPANTSKFELVGDISFYPEYQIIPNDRQPIQYVVVLDTSGSMSANFNGQCNNSGLVQCANGPNGSATVSGTGPNYWWTDQSERRIYVAKKALERLVALTNMPGNPGYDDKRPQDQMAFVPFTSGSKGVGGGGLNARDFSSAPGTLTTDITNANKTGGDVYRSNGGTNGAAGLYRASLLYAGAPKTVVYGTPAKTYTYKRVVLFITDGVSNNFLDTNNSSDLSGGGSTSFASGNSCRNSVNVSEDAYCQTTLGGGVWNGWDRPITQMVTTSNAYLKANGAEVFVIALSNIPSTGLEDGVASSKSYFFSAQGLTVNANGTTNVDSVIDTINTKVENAACTPGVGSKVTNGASAQVTMAQDEFINPTVGLNYPTVGQVLIDNGTGTALAAPITADSNGKLTYRFTNVPPGTYTMMAYIWYRNPLDPASAKPRRYNQIYFGDQNNSQISVDVSASGQGGSFTATKKQDLALKLDSNNICATN